MTKIIIIEDDLSIQKLISYALETNNYEGVSFSSGEEYFASGEKADLIILDVMLPNMDGFQILEKIRQTPETKDTPVMMLTARDNEIDKVQALNNGADDYMIKPFGVMELLARITALLRRINQGEESPFLTFPDGHMDISRRRVIYLDDDIKLTYKEFELLRYLLLNKGLVVTREQMMVSVWGYDYTGESRTIDMHIRLLRQKFGEGAKIIQTVRGVGYKIAEQ